MEANSIDLIFADPPYNIKKAEWDTFSSQKEYVDWSMEWISEAHRVLKRTGSLYVCGFSEILADIKWSASHLFKGCKWLIWFYRNKGNLGNDWGHSHESIILDPFGGSGTTYAVAEAYKRKWLGTELQIEYCQIIQKRLSDTEHISRIFNAKDEHESQKRRIKLRG